MNLKQGTSVFMSFLVLSMAQASFAGGQGQMDSGSDPNNGTPNPDNVNLPCPTSFLPGKLICEAGKWIASKIDPNAINTEGSAEGVAPQPRVSMPGFHRDGNCLTLGKNQDFYPFFRANDADIQAETKYYPDLQISISISQQSVIELRAANARGATEQDWPMAFHGPLIFCGSVDLQFFAEGHDNIKPWTKIEIGPNVRVQGQGNVNFVSSQLQYLEVTANCPASANLFDPKTPCIRFQNDLRTTSGSYLFIKHDGKETCRVTDLNLTDVEKITANYSKSNPMPCDHLASISQQRSFDLNLVNTPSTIPVMTTTTQTIPGSIVNGRQACDGPYYQPILATDVDPNYGYISQPADTQAPPVTATEDAVKKKSLKKQVKAKTARKAPSTSPVSHPTDQTPAHPSVSANAAKISIPPTSTTSEQ